MSEQAGFLLRLQVALITGAYAAALLAAVAALALLFHQPWLFPSLGPSIYLHVLTPDRPGALPVHTFGGHLLALGIGMVSVYLTGAVVAPPVTAGNAVTGARALGNL